MLSKIFAPPKAIPRLADREIDPAYKRYRRQVFAGIFIGYAAYYLVRKNFSIAKPYLINEMGLTTTDVGLIATGLSISYGISKFLMGNVSDRSNSQYFMAAGLIGSGIVNLFFGMTHVFPALMILWVINGWFQGMGWPPAGRAMTHWFSDGERGTKFGIWNISHNIGGGIIAPICSLALMIFGTWESMFYFPGVLAILCGIFVIMTVRDTPQCVGLPPIEEYKNDYPPTNVDDREREMTAKEIFFQYVLNNKPLWIIAFANVFIYIVRYGVLDWAPTYLTMAKGYNPGDSRWQFFLYEYAGIPGTILAGWASDRFFAGRRSPIMVIFMVLVIAFVLLYWLNPPGHYMIDSIALFAIGFLIYGPVVLVGISAADMVPKKAVGTAGGFTGLFGYFGGATVAELGIGWTVNHYGWDAGFYLLLISSVMATLLISLTWNVHNRDEMNSSMSDR